MQKFFFIAFMFTTIGLTACSDPEVDVGAKASSNDDTCNNSDDCDDGSCVDGECVECTRDNQCDDDEFCNDNNTCQQNDDECDRDSDCDNDEVCSNGECVPDDVECENDRDCDNDEVCNDDNECVSDTSGECDRDSDCNSDEICENDQCVDEECNRASDCNSDEVCDDGRCVDDGGSSNDNGDTPDFSEDAPTVNVVFRLENDGIDTNVAFLNASCFGADGDLEEGSNAGWQILTRRVTRSSGRFETSVSMHCEDGGQLQFNWTIDKDENNRESSWPNDAWICEADAQNRMTTRGDLRVTVDGDRQTIDPSILNTGTDETGCSAGVRELNF